MNYVGIDYHKKYSVVTAVDEKGQVPRTTRLDNRPEPFQTFFSSLDGPEHFRDVDTRRAFGLFTLASHLRPYNNLHNSSITYF